MNFSPEQLTEKLKKLFGANLKSVALYGSAASGEYEKRFSDYNLLVVADRWDFAALKKSAPMIRKWVQAGNPPPLLFTQDQLQRSTDIFPIEFLEMKEHHRILHGEDFLKDLEIRTENVRLELERELKTNLIKLRERFLLTADIPKQTQKLLLEASSTFLTLFRNVLRWRGISPLPSKKESPRVLAQLIPIDLIVFDYIEKLKSQDRYALREDPEPQIERFFKAIEQVIDKVDRTN